MNLFLTFCFFVYPHSLFAITLHVWWGSFHAHLSLFLHLLTLLLFAGSCASTQNQRGHFFLSFRLQNTQLHLCLPMKNDVELSHSSGMICVCALTGVFWGKTVKTTDPHQPGDLLPNTEHLSNDRKWWPINIKRTCSPVLTQKFVLMFVICMSKIW